jgi:hypothetical protein
LFKAVNTNLIKSALILRRVIIFGSALFLNRFKL